MDLLKRVNEEFQAILERGDPGSQIAWLTEQEKAKGVRMHGEPVPTFLKPYFVDAKHRSMMADATRLIVSSIEKVGAAFAAGYNFDGLIHQEGRVAELSKVDPLYPNYQVMVRLDAFFYPDSGEMKFLEFNCGDPSGMGWHDCLLDMFLNLPCVQELGGKFRLQSDRLLATQFQAVMKKYRQYCQRRSVPAKARPNCAIVCNRDSAIVDDLRLMAEYYNEQGCQTKLADPRDFAYDGRKLSLDGMEIEAIYRDIILDFIKDEYWAECQPIIQAYKDGNVCCVNPVRSMTGEFKTMTAVMTDGKYRHLFTREESGAMDRFIPWSRAVKDQKTDFHGRQVDLLPFLSENRESMVLKVNQAYGGFGITIGREVTQADWEAALEEALKGDYAVQEFVNIPTDSFPTFHEGRYQGFEPRNVNINYWCHDGQFAGAFLRASKGSLINVHQGGGLVPVFFAEDN